MVIAMLLWGFSWITAKLIAHSLGASSLVFWRFTTSAVSFLPFFLFQKKKTVNWRTYFVFILPAALLIAIYNQIFFRGLEAGMAGKSGVIVTTLNPLFAYLIALVFLREKLGKKKIIGLLLGIVGGILLMEPWNFSLDSLTDKVNLYFVLAAFVWALMSHFSSGAQKHVPVFTFNFYLYLTAALISLLFALPEKPFDLTQMTQPIWFNILYLGLAAGSLATGAYFYAGKKLGTSKGASFSFLVPGSALIFSAIFLGEIPGWGTIAGGIICLAAVRIIHRQD